MNRLILAGFGPLLAAGVAHAAPVTVNATILADNYSMAVLEQGSFQPLPSAGSPQLGNWPTPTSFSFQIDNDPEKLRTCRIHVIAWGDGSVAQGVMAHFAGTGGVNFTGKPGSSLNSVRMSTVTFANIPAALSQAQTNPAAIIGSLAGAGPVWTSQPAATGGLAGTWGPVALRPGTEGGSEIRFVWTGDRNTLNANPNAYRVISTPCDTVVRAVPPPPPPPPRPTPHVASWEIAGQFDRVGNSPGAQFEVWTYGYKEAADCTGPLIPFRSYINAPNRTGLGRDFRIWRRGPDANDNNMLPEVGQTASTTMTTPLEFSPNGISMHPGPQGQCAVVRFTAPDSGTYRLMGRFWGQNRSGTNVSTMVMRTPFGSTTPTSLDGPPVTVFGPGVGTPTNNPFTSVVTLGVGDTIDFMVGANGSFNSDSTGLHGYIQRDVP